MFGSSTPSQPGIKMETISKNSFVLDTQDILSIEIGTRENLQKLLTIEKNPKEVTFFLILDLFQYPF